MSKVFKLFSRQFIHPEMDISFSEKLKIEILAMLSIIGTALSIIYFIASITILPFTIVHHSTNLFWIIMFWGTSIFVFQKKYNTSKYYLLGASWLATLVNHFAYGTKIEATVVYVLISFAGYYLLEKRKRLPFIFSVLSSSIVIGLYQAQYPPPFEALAYSHFHPSYFIFSIILASNICLKVITEYDIFKEKRLAEERKLSTKNEQIRKFNQVLEKELRTPLHALIQASTLLSNETDNEIKTKNITAIKTYSAQLDSTLDSLKDKFDTDKKSNFND